MSRRWIVLPVLLSLAFSVLSSASEREDIHSRADLVQPLMAGMRAPDFVVRDVKNRPFRFKADRLDKPLVLTFFRGGWCPYCNLHLSELRLAEKELREIGFEVWFISIDKPELLVSSLEEPDLGYTIYSDSSLDATRAFGIAFEVDGKTIDLYKSYGIDLEKASGQTHHVLPAPSTFIIGTDGVIHFAYTNPNYKIRLSPEVLLAAAKAYQADVDKRLVRRLRQAMKK